MNPVWFRIYPFFFQKLHRTIYEEWKLVGMRQGIVGMV